MSGPVCGWCADGLCDGSGDDCAFRGTPIPCTCERCGVSNDEAADVKEQLRRWFRDALGGKP